MKRAREDLFERPYGFWRDLLDGVVARVLDCGIFERSFARIRCLDCVGTRLLLSWNDSGLFVHNAVTVSAGDGRALEARAPCCLRSPVSLARLRFSPGSLTATYLPRAGHDDEHAETFEAMDFVTRLLSHVPDPRRQLLHDYGACSNVGRSSSRMGAGDSQALTRLIRSSVFDARP